LVASQFVNFQVEEHWKEYAPLTLLTVTGQLASSPLPAVLSGWGDAEAGVLAEDAESLGTSAGPDGPQAASMLTPISRTATRTIVKREQDRLRFGSRQQSLRTETPSPAPLRRGDRT
jgi:hypothetical protein